MGRKDSQLRRQMRNASGKKWLFLLKEEAVPIISEKKTRMCNSRKRVTPQGDEGERCLTFGALASKKKKGG